MGMMADPVLGPDAAVELDGSDSDEDQPHADQQLQNIDPDYVIPTGGLTETRFVNLNPHLRCDRYKLFAHSLCICMHACVPSHADTLTHPDMAVL